MFGQIKIRLCHKLIYVFDRRKIRFLSLENLGQLCNHYSMIMSNKSSNYQKFRYRFNHLYVFIAAILFSGTFQVASAQQLESELLSTRPHFLDSVGHQSDSLFREDMKVIGKYVELDSVDIQMFRPSVLLMLIRNNHDPSLTLDYN